MNEIFYLPTLAIKPSQIYLCQSKIDAVKQWFQRDLSNFEPLPVYDFFKDGTLTLTDGHTRLFVAWQNGVERVPVYFEYDEIVTDLSGQKLYKKCIQLCKAFGLQDISYLKDRILSPEEYRQKWIDYCEAISLEE